MNRRTRVVLVRHAPTPATRRGAFPVTGPGEEDLDERGREQAVALRGTLPAAEVVLTSPARRAVETAMLAGYEHAAVEPALAECDFGSWSGRSLAEVEADDGEALLRWYADPDARPTGGESARALSARVTALLDRLAGGEDTLCFTHGGAVRVAVLHALGAPLESVWRIDVAPCSITELHARPDGGWTVACMNVPAPSRSRVAT